MKNKSLALVVAAIILPAASPPPASHVSLQIPATGCLSLPSRAPAQLSVQPVRAQSDTHDWPVERAVKPPAMIALDLHPGYYFLSISSQRCWINVQPFVVGSAWNRTIAVVPGRTILPPQKNLFFLPPILDKRSSSGLVIHADPSITKVRVKYDGGTDAMDRSGGVWYLDDAHVGPVKVRMYAGNTLVRSDSLVLPDGGFVEKFYTRPALPIAEDLWATFSVRVPHDARKTFDHPFTDMTQGTYRFERLRNGRTDRITFQMDELDKPGFLTWSEVASAKEIALDGMRAWRYVHKGVVSIQVNLPKPSTCTIQWYALMTYSAGDHWASEIAYSLRLKRPYHCSNATP